jgi:hypothetical protein
MSRDLRAWCESDRADYFLVQSGRDLAELSGDGFGYHWTSRAGAKTILRKGLSAPTTWFKEHEIPYAYCMLDGAHSDMADAAGQSDAAIERAFFKQCRKVRSFWFASDPDYEGETAGDADVRLVIDLTVLGGWIARLPDRPRAVSPFAFPDHAGGWGVYWSGPAISAKLVVRAVEER